MNWTRTLVALALATSVAAGGCNNSTTATEDMGNALMCPTGTGYPGGPYGATVGEVISDLCLRIQNGAAGAPADSALSLYRQQLIASGNKVLAVAGAAEWCGPCRAEQPELVALYNDYKAKNAGVAFLVVVSEKNAGVVADDAAAQNWATTYSLPFEVASDQARALSPYFDTKSYPNSMVIKLSDMSITYYKAGKDTASLKAAIDDALK